MKRKKGSGRFFPSFNLLIYDPQFLIERRTTERQLLFHLPREILLNNYLFLSHRERQKKKESIRFIHRSPPLFAIVGSNPRSTTVWKFWSSAMKIGFRDQRDVDRLIWMAGSEIIVADSVEKLFLSIIEWWMHHRCYCFLKWAIFPIFLISLCQSPASLNFDALRPDGFDDDDDGELSVSDIAGYVELIGKRLREGVKGIRENFKLAGSWRYGGKF